MQKKVLVKCVTCSKFFGMDKVKIKEKKNIKIENEKMDLIYYRCPKCKQIYIVGIMNEESKRLQDVYKKLNDEVGQLMLQKKMPTKELLETVEKSKQANISYQKQLKANLSDKIPYDIL